MALTKSFKELVQRPVANDPAFATALLREGIDTMLTGDIDTGKENPARLHQGDDRLREAGRGHGHVAQKPDQHVRSVRQSLDPQSLRHHRLPATAGRHRIARHDTAAWRPGLVAHIIAHARGVASGPISSSVSNCRLSLAGQERASAPQTPFWRTFLNRNPQNSKH